MNAIKSHIASIEAYSNFVDIPIWICFDLISKFIVSILLHMLIIVYLKMRIKERKNKYVILNIKKKYSYLCNLTHVTYIRFFIFFICANMMIRYIHIPFTFSKKYRLRIQTGNEVNSIIETHLFKVLFLR